MKPWTDLKRVGEKVIHIGAQLKKKNIIPLTEKKKDDLLRQACIQKRSMTKQLTSRPTSLGFIKVILVKVNSTSIFCETKTNLHNPCVYIW